MAAITSGSSEHGLKRTQGQAGTCERLCKPRGPRPAAGRGDELIRPRQKSAGWLGRTGALALGLRTHHSRPLGRSSNQSPI